MSLFFQKNKILVCKMSTKNDTNPIDLDVTVQMQNDRMTFQYQSIIETNSGDDLLQNVLDSNATLSDTQVEIAIDTNDIYSENGTVENITELLQDAYTLILPKKHTLQGNTTGVLVFSHDASYNQVKRDLDADDMFRQNSRTRYPPKSLVGSFIPVNSDLIGGNSTTTVVQGGGGGGGSYWRTTDNVTPSTQFDIEYGNLTSESPGNVTVHTQLRVHNAFIGAEYETATITNDVSLRNLIPQANITVNGLLAAKNISISENLNMLSDARLKTNIVPIHDTMSGLSCIQPVSYDWKHKKTKREIGFIAQNVQTIYPQLVQQVDSTSKVDTEKILTVNYIGFIPLLTAAIQEQQKELKKLRDEIQDMKKQLR